MYVMFDLQYNAPLPNIWLTTIPDLPLSTTTSDSSTWHKKETIYYSALSMVRRLLPSPTRMELTAAVFDLPEELLATLALKDQPDQPTEEIPPQIPATANESSDTAEDGSNSPAKATSCNLC